MLAFTQPVLGYFPPFDRTIRDCGINLWLHVAVAKILVQRARELCASGVSPIPPELLHEAVVSDVPRFLKEVEKAMSHVRAMREAWILEKPELFPTEQSKKNHLRGWIANYELSELIHDVIGPDLNDSHAPAVDFVRFSQWHEASSATPDELVQIENTEKRFGGRADASNPGQVTFDEGDSVFIIERFDRQHERHLLSPDEWWEAERAIRLKDPQANHLRVFCIDLKGHFSAGWSVEPGHLFFINTTESNYVKTPIIDWYYDLRFPPFQDAAGREASGGQVNAVVRDAGGDTRHQRWGVSAGTR